MQVAKIPVRFFRLPVVVMVSVVLITMSVSGIASASNNVDKLLVQNTSSENSESPKTIEDPVEMSQTSENSTGASEESEHQQESSSPLSALAGTFGINSKLFIGQLINFVIVLLLFWRFVAKPLGNLMTERSEKIAKGLKLAESMSAEKEELLNLENKTKADLIRLKKQIIAEAEEKAKNIISEANQKAILEARAIVQEASRQIASQKESLEKELKQMTYDVAASIATKVLDREVKLTGNDPLIKKNV